MLEAFQSGVVLLCMVEAFWNCVVMLCELWLSQLQSAV